MSKRMVNKMLQVLYRPKKKEEETSSFMKSIGEMDKAIEATLSGLGSTKKKKDDDKADKEKDKDKDKADKEKDKDKDKDKDKGKGSEK